MDKSQETEKQESIPELQPPVRYVGKVSTSSFPVDKPAYSSLDFPASSSIITVAQHNQKVNPSPTASNEWESRLVTCSRIGNS